MRLIRKFKEKNWLSLTPAKRQDILQKLENKMARRAGRPPLPLSINPDRNWNCFGMFESIGNKQILYLNLELIANPNARFQALSTILHEGRHATQHFVANQDPAWFQFKAKRWRNNMANYVSSSTSKDIYAVQEVERDAQLFAISHLKRWQNIFKNEPAYQATLERLIYQFEQHEQKAKEQFGPFYRTKIRRILNKKH